ncbi:MAG TPA: ribosome assembly RNA-binding protein YhbY [Thermoanaerobaculia bacterium]|jgi:RNA-binding protein|nr:ribosome assembly RNA-binding protein YhbY [Thermoanaerobaculia bacterium]
MEELSGAQRKHLRGLAHHVKPVVHVGRNGVTGSVLQEVEEALDYHELIKVKLVDPQGRKKELADELASRSGGTRVGLVGNIVTLYRQNPDPEKRKVEVP